LKEREVLPKVCSLPCPGKKTWGWGYQVGLFLGEENILMGTGNKVETAFAK